MAQLVFIFSGAVFLSTIFLADLTKGPLLKTPYFHPVFFLGFMSLLIGLDFLVLGTSLSNGDTIKFSYHTMVGMDNFNGAGLTFMIITFSSVAGYALGLTWPLRMPVVDGYFSRIYRENGVAGAAVVPLAIFSAAFLIFMAPAVFFALARGGFFAVAGIRGTFLNEYPLFSLIIACLVPAFFLLCAGSPNRRTVLILFLLLSFVQVVIGSRGSIVMMILGLVISRYHDRRVPFVAIAVMFVVLVLVGYYYTYLTRYSWAYSSLQVFWDAEGDPFTYIMKSPELSIAESMMLHLNQNLIDRDFFESTLGAVLAYVPRAVIPWKPEGISTEMTEFIDPERWARVRSEWTLSGYVNAVYEMGVFGGAIFNAIIFFVLGGLFSRARQNRSLMIFGCCTQIFLMLGYLRGDIYNLGLRSWAIITVLLVFQLAIIVAPRRKRFRSKAHSAGR